MAEVTYYFDSLGAAEWTTNPSYMFDNILTNYAVTSVSGDINKGASNTCPGTELGTISTVEFRAYGYGDGDDEIEFQAIIDASQGTLTAVTMPSSAGWSAYADMTGAPFSTPPTWAEIVACDANVYFTKQAKGNTMYCAKVEIRVTYSEGVPAGWNKVFYTSEPPTPNAWNQVKREAGTGWRKLEYS